MATIKEVAALAGVSIGTVSHVLGGVRKVHPAIRERVEEAVRKLDYKPNPAARSLKSKKTRTIGMVVSDLTNPFFSEMMRGAEDAALARGYLLTTFNTDDKPDRERQVFEVLGMRRMDGLLVVVALHQGQHPHVRQAVESGVPVVCLDRKPADLDVDSVTVDNAEGVEAAVRHLVECGYRRIAYIGGAPSMYLASERLQGYKRAIRKAGLPSRALAGDFRSESGYALCKKLLDSAPAERPDAIFAANFLMAAGALEAIHDAGLRVPEDIGLACFDFIALLKGFKPNLTAVAQPAYQLGLQGANLLIDRLEGSQLLPREPVHRVLPLDLRIGDSTRPVKARKAG